MKRFKKTVFVLAAVSLTFGVAACGDSDTPGAPMSGEPALGTQSSAVSGSPAQNMCARDRDGHLNLIPDACPASSAPRVLVRVSSGATCASVLAAIATTSPGARVGSAFNGAPAEIQDHFCVFTGNADDATVPRLLSTLCGNEPIQPIQLATHDCSGGLVSSPTDPADFVSPEGHVAGPSDHAPHTIDPGGVGESPHPCDACAVVKSNTLYVSLPPQMVGTGHATMFARFLDSTLPDVEIVPPEGAQTFSVSNVFAPDSTQIRVFAPGTTPPAK